MAEREVLQEQSVNIAGRKRIDVVGAIEVLSSTEREVYVKTDESFLLVSGEKLSILKLIPESKLLSVSGIISGVQYLSKLSKKSLFGKVFK